MSAYAYITNTTPDAPKPTFEQEPDDDQVSFRENLRKGYLTHDEAVYYGSKQFNLDEIPVRVE